MARTTDDRGMGLVEILVSMLVLGLLVAAFAPLVVQAMIVTAKNNTLATAARLANERLEDARAVASTGDCTALSTFLSSADSSRKDGRSLSLTVSSTLSSCAPGGLSDVTVQVTTSSPQFTNPTLAHVRTQIYVTAP